MNHSPDIHARLREQRRHLPAMMGLVQESVTQASDAIGARYFMSGPVQEWTGEIL